MQSLVTCSRWEPANSRLGVLSSRHTARCRLSSGSLRSDYHSPDSPHCRPAAASLDPHAVKRHSAGSKRLSRCAPLAKHRRRGSRLLAGASLRMNWLLLIRVAEIPRRARVSAAQTLLRHAAAHVPAVVAADEQASSLLTAAALRVAGARHSVPAAAHAVTLLTPPADRLPLCRRCPRWRLCSTRPASTPATWCQPCRRHCSACTSGRAAGDGNAHCWLPPWCWAC